MPSGPATLELMSGTISSGIGVYLGVHGVSRKRRLAIHVTTTGKAAQQLAASSIRQTAR
jgi:hypothetical protein